MPADNFEFIHLQTYSSKEPLADDKKKYRRVFDKSYTNTLFFELVLKNKRSGIDNWVAEIQIVCYRIESDSEFIAIYREAFNKFIGLYEQSVHITKEYTPNQPDDLVPGMYYCKAIISEKDVSSPIFFITSIGEATYTENPYFRIENIKMFKQKDNIIFGKFKTQLNQFGKDDTKFIHIEVHIKNKIDYKPWVFELFLSCFTAAGELKERHTSLQTLKKGEYDCLMALCIGSEENDYWQPGEYSLQLSFMDIIIAQCYFTISDIDEEGVIYFETDPAVIAKLDKIQQVKRARSQFSKLTESKDFTEFPETIKDDSAVQIAYGEELDRISGYIRNGLSVLIICDKMLIEFIYHEVCRRAGKYPIQDNFNFDTKEFIRTIQQLSEGEILILRTFEILADIMVGSTILFQTDKNNNLPQILAFSDSSVPVKEVLRRRFALPERIQGIPREIEIEGKKLNPLPYLITKKERDFFKCFDETEIYKHVFGLNILQFRNAFKYLQSVFTEPTDSEKIYQTLRIFKQHSNNSDIDLPTTTFDDIGGYVELKHYIQTSLSLFQKVEENLPKEQQQEVIPKGFIFYGPPGTGKTMFAKAIANYLNATIQMISGPEIVEMWVGKSEENLRHIFATARRNAPSVILFDEFDSIAVKRSTANSGSAMVANSLMAQLLTELDGFHPNDGVLVIGTTNRIDIIDQALMRPSRLRPIFIDLPDLEGRKKVARIHAQRYNIDKLIDEIVEISLQYFEGWKNSAEQINDRQIPDSFFSNLNCVFPSFEKRRTEENTQQTLNNEISEFFKFIQKLDYKGITDDSSKELIKSVSSQYEDLQMKIKVKTNNAVANSHSMTMLEKDFFEIYVLLNSELLDGKAFVKQSFFDFLIDLIAEFTEGFNNDEIGSLFKEAIVAHGLEGKLLSPKYFGEKIGMIKAMKETKGITAILLRR